MHKECQPYCKNYKFMSRTLSVLYSYDTILTGPLYGWVETGLLISRIKVLTKNPKDCYSSFFSFEKILDNFVFKSNSEKGKIDLLKFHAVIFLH